MDHQMRKLICLVLLSAFICHGVAADGKQERSQSPSTEKGQKVENEGDESDEKTEEELREEWLRKMLPKEIIVVGAGMSGLAAARRITENKSNFTVKIFEGQRDRYGGRVWTDKLTNMKARGVEVDLGGSAFNTLAKNNPLIQLAEDFELKMTSVDNLQFIIPWENKAFSGEQLSEISKEAATILSKALNESSSWKQEVSVTVAVDRVLEEGEIANSESPGAELVKCLPSYILGDYSTRNYVPDVLDFGYEKVLLDGMGELLDRFVSGSPEEPPLHLNLNKAVRQIKVNEEKKRVIVRTTDGLQSEVDIVIVAVPPSVIAAGDIIFDPPLPKAYQLAFSEMSMSSGDKVVVEFEHAFWPSEFGVFVRAVSSVKERGHLQTWINIQRILSKPVLSSFLTGQPAIDFEKLTDEEAEKAVLVALTDMFGSDRVKTGGKIVRLQRSKWFGSHWSRGASTYPKVGTTPKLWDSLAEPLCPYIYFVGEHTSFEAHGTLHGAYNSGIRAGDQILSFFCDRKMEEERKRREERRKKDEEKKKGDTKKDKNTEGEQVEQAKNGESDERDEL